MMGELEAVGDLVTGGVLGRAVEPSAGEPGPDGHTHEANCLNCGTTLAGTYCHACGQHAHVHRTLGAFFHDLVHGILHVDGKLWRTLPLLAWRPGELTRRYIDGERAKFISPMALFLFTVFLTYAIFSLVSGSIKLANFTGDEQPLAQSIYEEKSRIVTEEAKRAEALAEGRMADARAAERAIKEATEDAAVLTSMEERGITSVAMDEVAKDQDVTGDRTFVNAVKKVRENPQLYAYKVQTNAYKFSWLLIPISVPFLWLLFPFSRRFHLYDHTVFVTYSIAFMTFVIMMATTAGIGGYPVVTGLLLLYMPFHMYRQLKGTYGLGRASAIVRTTLLSVFATVALTLFILAIVAGVSQ